MLLSDLLAGLDQLIPFRYAESWDKVGLHIGDPGRTIRRVLLALDLTSGAIDAACSQQADLILCHHPPIFSPLAGLRADRPTEWLPVRALQANLAVAALHTNLDAVPGGVADQFASLIGLQDVTTFVPLGSEAGPATAGPATAGPATAGPSTAEPMQPESASRKASAWALAYPASPGFGRCGSLPQPLALAELAGLLRQRLATPWLMVAAPHGRPVRRITVCPGSYDGSWTPLAVAQGTEALVTGEIKYHDRLLLTEAGIPVIAVGHDVSERVVLSPLAELLAGVWPELAFAVEPGFDYNKMAF